MKKDTILGFVALVLLVFALKSIAEECSDTGCADEEVIIQSNYRRSRGINCVECCRSGGRFVSDRCLNECGGCAAYSDEAMAEAHDYPPNDDSTFDY